MGLAARGVDGPALDPGDLAVDQGDVGLGQRLVPAVVEQHALAERREVRSDLVDEVGPVGQLLLDVADEHLAVALVGRVDRPFRMGPLRVLLERLVHLAVEHPAQPQPVEPLVVGDFAEQEAHRLGHRLVEFGEGGGPLPGALEDGERAYRVGDGGNELHGAGAVADHRHVLACELHRGVPLRGVDDRAVEVAQARDRRPLGRGEGADGGDDDVRHQRLLRPVGKPKAWRSRRGTPRRSGSRGTPCRSGPRLQPPTPWRRGGSSPRPHAARGRTSPSRRRRRCRSRGGRACPRRSPGNGASARPRRPRPASR